MTGCATGSHTANMAINPDDKVISQTLNMTEEFEWIEYIVQEGDTISSIATKFNITTASVILCNEKILMQNDRKTVQGVMLRIPGIDGITHKVRSSDSIAAISSTYNIPPQVIIDVNGIESDNLIEGENLFIPGVMDFNDFSPVYRELFITPLDGIINSNFGWQYDQFSEKYKFHNGIDIQDKIGTPVLAAIHGIVKDTGNDPSYGKYIIITNGVFQILYAHLSIVSVKDGVQVSQGHKIGELGNTGSGAAPYLHFSTFINGKAVDPILLFKR
jgi:murein DD-endopeptidase MepM/ murein hydrolase activator NlpD